MTKKQPTFEEHLAEVEGAIRKLEGGDIPLEDSIDLYAEAMAHLKACHAVLDKAEKRLEIVKKSVEGGDVAAPADVDDDGVKPR
jgi:exodeoxyribonuclease VII small subunit